MTVLLKNNVVGYLAAAIGSSDTGIALQTGNGAYFPLPTGSDYFYATLVSTSNTVEVIKVTARSDDTLTVTRAQDGTTALSFAAGSRVELRVNAAAITDTVNLAVSTAVAGVMSDFAASSGSTLVGHAGGTGAVSTTVGALLRNYVHVEQYGAVGDNSTDDYTAITNAATEAAAQGSQLIFDGTKTYKINQDTLTFPAGLNVRFNGAILNFTKTQGSSTNPAVSITGPFNADFLRVNIPTGVVRNYGVSAEGNNVSIGRVTVTSVDVQPQLAAAGDYGVQFANGARFLCDRITVTNFDRAVIIDTTTDSTIGGINVDSYVRAIYEVDNLRLKIGASVVKTRSPNASNTAGHNGFLSSGGTNNSFEDFTVLDAAEEGVRIGGGPQYNITLTRFRVKDAQANGIKVLGTNNATPVTGEYMQGIIIDSPIIEDCGTNGGTADRCGILVQRSVGVQINNPIIRPRDNTYCAVYGIEIYASEDVNITNPIIQDAEFSGIYMPTALNTNYADISRVNITGGMISGCGADGLQFTATNAMIIRHVQISNIKLWGNGRRGATLSAGTGGSFLSCFLSAHFYNNTEDTIVSNDSSWLFDCWGNETYGSGSTTFASIVAKNSSRWSNETTLYILKAGTWTAL